MRGQMLRPPLVLLLGLHATSGIVDDDGVRILKGSSFADAVRTHADEGLLVDFYAPWCRHCTALAPEFARACEEVDAACAKVDVTAEAALAASQIITNYPALRFYRQGRVVDATPGATDAAAIAATARRLARDRYRTLTTVAAVDELFAGRGGVRVLALVPDESKAAQAFRHVAEAFKYPAEFFLLDGPDLMRHALDEAEKRRLYASAEASAHANSVLLLKPYDELVDVAQFKTSKKGRKKLGRWIEDRMLPLVVPFLPDYVDMIFGGPLKIHAILAVNPAAPPAPQIRDAFYNAARRHRGRIMHIAMFKESGEDESYNEALRHTLRFLKVTRFPTYLVSDMTGATPDNPGGSQTHFDGDLADADAVLEFQRPFAAKPLALRDGRDARTAELLRNPKFQALVSDPRMASLIEVLGVPRGLVDQARAEL